MNTAIQKIEIENREQWLALRETDVTASVGGALFGIHPYHSVFSLYLLKRRELVEDPEETPAMRRGRLMEDVAIKMLLEDHPDWRIERPNVYLRDAKARLGATPDAYVYIPGRPGFGVLQLKSVEPSIFKAKWLTEQQTVEPPLWIAVQAEIERYLSKANFAMVGVVRAGFGIECSAIPIPGTPGLIDKIKLLTTDFWRMVDAGKRPDPDYEKDGKLLEAMWASGGNSAILDLENDNHLVDLADEKERLASEKTAIEKRQAAVKAEIMHKLGGAAAAKIADGRLITAKKVEKASYTVKPSSYVLINVKAAKE